MNYDEIVMIGLHCKVATNSRQARLKGAQWAKTLKISNAKVIRVSGMQVEHRCDINEGEIVEPNQEEQILS
uniref:Uncharacterized protein n=1 Tax=Timema douglasi TaxID=61478 RepID=A0A7R8VBJ1_TIMDO|nr:unnamed protein product [Timema douglasi]